MRREITPKLDDPRLDSVLRLLGWSEEMYQDRAEAAGREALNPEHSPATSESTRQTLAVFGDFAWE